MRLIEYIESCLNDWPDEISTEGSYKITENLYFFANLIEVHNGLTEKEDDYFEGVVIYEIFKYQFDELKNKFDQNDLSAFRKSEIDRTLLEHNILKEVQEINDPELIDRLKQFE